MQAQLFAKRILFSLQFKELLFTCKKLRINIDNSTWIVFRPIKAFYDSNEL